MPAVISADDSRYGTEQDEILQFSFELDQISGRSWKKYKGQQINQKIIRLLSSQLSGTACKVVGPTVYVTGFPTEFDAAIVKSNAEPDPKWGNYSLGDILVLIEVKKHGFYFKKIEGPDLIRKYFEVFRAPGKPFVYISVAESSRFISDTHAAIGEDAFFLSLSGNRHPYEGAWRKFVERIKFYIE